MMVLNYFRFLFLQLLCIYITLIRPGVNSEGPCLIPSNYSSRNSTGACTPIQNCSSTIGLLVAGVKPTICGKDESGSTTVCCPNTKRISAEKCEEFKSVLREPIRSNGALTYDGGANQKRTEDNQPVKCETFFVTFITGGRQAREREYPYQVALGYGDKPDWRCGATLIDRQFLLTAGHCAQTAYGPPTVALLGDRKLSARKDPSRLLVNISEVYLHPHFKPPVQYNDIALLKLSSPVPLSRAILPACLPKPGDRLDREQGIEATGWGQTSAFGGQSDILQSTTIAKFPTSECKAFFESDNQNKKRLPKGIIRSQFCAGDKNGYRDTCKGDSGGGVTVSDSRWSCIHYVVGVTSFGSNLCGYQQPGVYTNVISFLDWIEDVVWYNLSNPQNSRVYAKTSASNGALILNSADEKENTPTNPVTVSTEGAVSPSEMTTESNATNISASTSAPSSGELSTSSEATSMLPPHTYPTSTASTKTQTQLTSSLQNMLMEATTNEPSNIYDDSYFNRITNSISSLFNNISIGR